MILGGTKYLTMRLAVLTEYTVQMDGQTEVPWHIPHLHAVCQLLKTINLKNDLTSNMNHIQHLTVRFTIT